jgi:biofilm PGA synthesis N-glycosyltransferase PgaC
MKSGFYLSVRLKFLIAMGLALCWMESSTLLALAWFIPLAGHIGKPLAGLLIFGIAIGPGFMNAFLMSSLMLDRRPPRRKPAAYPPLSIIIAAYNEEKTIADTLQSLAGQAYPGGFEAIVVNDGSRDATWRVIKELATQLPWVKPLNVEANRGKAHALNVGLAQASHELVVTLDADTYLYKDALANLVERYLSDPTNTRAVGGAILVRNSRDNWITRVQEWDYFHGISTVKRVQSLYQGLLVAHGSFSLYDRQALRDVGGWRNVVGEDIVLTWALLEAGHRVGYCEDACAFTIAPNTLLTLSRQRQRWARGMIEAFRYHGGLLFKPRMSTLFVWWNLFFPLLDTAVTVGFLPGLVLALFGRFWIVGPMSVALLPITLLMNREMFFIGWKTFDSQKLVVRRNRLGLAVYMLAYNLLLQPVAVGGYAMELLRLRKRWGTK